MRPSIVPVASKTMRPLLGGRDGADEPRRAGKRSAVAQSRVDDLELLGVGGAVEARGVDARLAVQPVDLQAGIVRRPSDAAPLARSAAP